jgi:hypothetical protein
VAAVWDFAAACGGAVCARATDENARMHISEKTSAAMPAADRVRRLRIMKLLFSRRSY